MTVTPDPAAVARRHQRQVFFMGCAAAAVPIVCQLLMLLVVSTSPAAFPKADKSFIEVKFWPIQIVLLFLAVSGNVFVDFAKFIVDHRVGVLDIVIKFLLMGFAFLVISLLFSVTLLDTELSWIPTTTMAIFGLAGLYLAYRVGMDIALIEAGIT